MTHRHYGFGKPPAKGTKMRQLLLRALRPCGVTSMECRDLFPSGGHFGVALSRLEAEKGYDFKAFDCPEDRRGTATRRKPHVIRLVGKVRWDGTYRSFIHDASRPTQGIAA